MHVFYVFRGLLFNFLVVLVNLTFNKFSLADLCVITAFFNFCIWSLVSAPGFIPVCSLGVSQVGRMNFGKDVSTLKYFTICGLQEGYEPFAVNMNRNVTMWLSKRLPQFVPVPSDHQHIKVSKVTWNNSFYFVALVGSSTFENFSLSI